MRALALRVVNDPDAVLAHVIDESRAFCNVLRWRLSELEQLRDHRLRPTMLALEQTLDALQPGSARMLGEIASRQRRELGG
jgi:hypothetical protein